MLLKTKDMEAQPLAFAHTWQPGEFDFTESGMSQGTPLTARGTAELVEYSPGEVRVHGHVQTTLSTECDRCLAPATYPVDTPFDLRYRPAGETDEATDEEIAIDEEEAEIGFYDPPGIILEDVLREQILLQIPMRRLCSEDCAGICPVCGGNRNEIPCNCETHPTDDRWAGLTGLKIDSPKPTV